MNAIKCEVRRRRLHNTTQGVRDEHCPLLQVNNMHVSSSALVAVSQSFHLARNLCMSFEGIGAGEALMGKVSSLNS